MTARSTWLSSHVKNAQHRRDTDPSGTVTRRSIWPGAGGGAAAASAARLFSSDQLYIRLHIYVKHLHAKQIIRSIAHQQIWARTHLN